MVPKPLVGLPPLMAGRLLMTERCAFNALGQFGHVRHLILIIIILLIFTLSSSSGLLDQNPDSTTRLLQPTLWSKMGLHLLQS